jgi:hypothetical protein
MMKLAAGVPDAGIQELLAYRRGEEYLTGGQLESNTAEEAVYQAKMAFDPKMGLAAGNYDLKAKTKKKDSTYQKVRDYGATGLKGGLTGLGVMGALNTMRGRFGSPGNMSEVRRAMGKARAFAGVGASAAVADRAYRHDEFPKTADIGALVVNATPGPFRSPGAQLSQARATGLFRNVNHETEGLKPKSLQYGKFQVR